MRSTFGLHIQKIGTDKKERCANKWSNGNDFRLGWRQSVESKVIAGDCAMEGSLDNTIIIGMCPQVTDFETSFRRLKELEISSDADGALSTVP